MPFAGALWTAERSLGAARLQFANQRGHFFRVGAKLRRVAINRSADPPHVSSCPARIRWNRAPIWRAFCRKGNRFPNDRTFMERFQRSLRCPALRVEEQPERIRDE